MHVLLITDIYGDDNVKFNFQYFNKINNYSAYQILYKDDLYLIKHSYSIFQNAQEKNRTYNSDIAQVGYWFSLKQYMGYVLYCNTKN